MPYPTKGVSDRDAAMDEMMQPGSLPMEQEQPEEQSGCEITELSQKAQDGEQFAFVTVRIPLEMADGLEVGQMLDLSSVLGGSGEQEELPQVPGGPAQA